MTNPNFPGESKTAEELFAEGSRWLEHGEREKARQMFSTLHKLYPQSPLVPVAKNLFEKSSQAGNQHNPPPHGADVLGDDGAELKVGGSPLPKILGVILLLGVAGGGYWLVTNKLLQSEQVLIVRKYLESKNVEGRHKYVCRSPQLTVLDMFRLYGKQNFKDIKVGKVKLEGKDDGSAKVEASWTAEGKSESATYKLVKKSYGWCIDWIGDGKVDPGFVEAFHSRKTIFGYVHIKLSAHYNYEFRGKQDTYYSFEINWPYYAYLSKDSAEAQKIFKAARSGNYVLVKCILKHTNRLEKGIMEMFKAEVVTYAP